MTKMFLIYLLVSFELFADVLKPNETDNILESAPESVHILSKKNAINHVVFKYQFLNKKAVEVIDYKLTLVFNTYDERRRFMDFTRKQDLSEGLNQDILNFGNHNADHQEAHYDSELRERWHTHYSFLGDKMAKTAIKPVELEVFLGKAQKILGVKPQEIDALIAQYQTIYSAYISEKS